MENSKYKNEQYHRVDLNLLDEHKEIMLGNFKHLVNSKNEKALRRILRSAMIVGSIIGTNKVINKEIKEELK